ncbi:MAG: hypothetical protein K0S80_1711 [Neobacillus sp.]|nr:hypothetical protein [Neobacillus sp.]
MSQIRDEYVGRCTNCGKEIRSNDYWEAFDGYGLHELFCSRACNDEYREENPIDHQAWKD